MQRFFLIAITGAGLVSCSSNSGNSGVDPEPSGANQVTISKDGSNNPFAFSPEDVKTGDDGRVTGGKRSQYELKSESAYAKANAEAPKYFEKSYQRQAWSGSRDYSTGSYQTAANTESKRKSWFGGRKSGASDKVAVAAGQGYDTGSYRTGTANESGRVRSTGTSGYVDEQAADGWRKIQILENREYRKLSIGQARSLLGR